MATKLNVTKGKGPGAQVSIGSGQNTVRAQGNPIPYIVPWAVALLILGVAGIARRVLHADEYSWVWSTLVAAVGVALTVVAHRASRPRGDLVNTLAKWGVAAACGWSWWAIGTPELTWRPIVGYLLATVTVAGGANLVVAFKGNGDGDGGGLHEGVAGAIKQIRNLNETRVIDGTVEVGVRMQPGTPIGELQKATDSLASLYGVPTNGVKVIGDRNDASAGTMRVSPVDYLATPPPYAGPSVREGGSIMDPIRVGVRLGGHPLQFHLPGDAAAGRNASLVQVTGMAGGGKTEFIRQVLIELLSRGGPDEVEYWYLNSRKADQEPDWVREGAARFENTSDGVKAALKELRAEMSARAKHLGERGLDQWAPGCGIAFRLVVCDEFADVASDVERMLVDLSETLRSLGVILLCGFQRATGDRFPTSARSNFGTHVCFGVKDEVDASMALPDEVLDAGAKPWAWGNKFPGYCYLTAPGVPEDLWPDEGRTFKPNRQVMQQWAEHYIGLRARGAATVAPARLPVPVEGEVESTETPFPVAEQVDADDELAPFVDDDGYDDEEFDDEDDADLDDTEDLIRDTLDDDEPADVDDQEEERQLKPKVPGDCAEVWTVSHRAPIEVDGGGMDLRLSPKMSDDDARTYLRSYILRLRSQGVTGFKVEDIGEDVLHATGMKASWLSKWLGRLCDGSQPLLSKRDGRGHYDIVGLAALGDGR